MARALPASLAGALSFATDGQEALQQVRLDPPDLLLLDLTMPVMDGYTLLSVMRDEGIDVPVVVVSGDVQQQAHTRVMDLGAVGFIAKPVTLDALRPILQGLGMQGEAQEEAFPDSEFDIPVDALDSYRELINVAMGRAGDLLARLLKTFIRLSVPKVNLFESGELHMTLSHITGRDNVHAVTQGFVARGLAGEAVLIFSDSSFQDIGKLLNYPPPIDETAKTELLMDIANLLISACLKGISQQLDRPFSEGRPVILGRNTRLEEMLAGKHNRWRSTLAAEVSYEVAEHDINCELLLLFTADSLPALDQQLALLGMRG
jgi:CheY-like chemotaxis protein